MPMTPMQKTVATSCLILNCALQIKFQTFYTASAALPPSFNAFMPMLLHMLLSLATAPFRSFGGLVASCRGFRRSGSVQVNLQKARRTSPRMHVGGKKSMTGCLDSLFKNGREESENQGRGRRVGNPRPGRELGDKSPYFVILEVVP